MAEALNDLAVGLGRPVFPAGSSGISITRISDQNLLDELAGMVRFFFARSTEYYVRMELQEYRSLIVRAQDEINVRGFGRRLARDRVALIRQVLASECPLIQTNVYLRATRPDTAGVQENVGWHRESFYGPKMAESINFWLPIANVSIENVMQYIPESHTIPDEEITTVGEADDTVKRFSAGHKVGLLYAPKRITAGVDLSNPKPFIVLPGEAAIFAGALIHGAAENRSDKIRFSLDFRLIAKESYWGQKQQHFASGKSYFEPL
jgi:hypothetical protein